MKQPWVVPEPLFSAIAGVRLLLNFSYKIFLLPQKTFSVKEQLILSASDRAQ
jgi:hypothetical protein